MPGFFVCLVRFQGEFGGDSTTTAVVIVLFQKSPAATLNSLLGCLDHSVGVNLDCEPVRVLCGYEISRRVFFPFPPSVKVEVGMDRFVFYNFFLKV